MKTKRKLFLPLLLALLIAASCVGGWYWYDNNVDRSGWVEKDGIRFYRDFHADPVSGWLTLEEGTYYFCDDGPPHTGWLENAGNLYYFGPNGHMVEGWLWLEDSRYYLRDGALLTGWQEIDGNQYWFNEGGIAALGFAEIDGNQYYFDDGILSTGLKTIEEETYLFAEDGIQITGWWENEEGTRYFTPEGPMATGWLELEGNRYFFQDSGIMQTGWLEEGEYQYYFYEDGTAATGCVTIDGQTRYFSPKGIHVVLVNALNPVPEWYTQDLVYIDDTHRVDNRCYDALTQMLADCTAAGITYNFNSGYRTLSEQTAILEYRTREHMKTYDLEFEEARDKAYETVAVPGTSEHHLGLAVDILGTEAIAWLTEHCWDYGFIVRYTEEKEPITGIVDEPWHFRYVGREVSLDLKDSGLCLEEYLGAEAVTWEKTLDLYGDKLYEETIYQEPEPTQTTKNAA